MEAEMIGMGPERGIFGDGSLGKGGCLLLRLARDERSDGADKAKELGRGFVLRGQRLGTRLLLFGLVRWSSKQDEGGGGGTCRR